MAINALLMSDSGTMSIFVRFGFPLTNISCPSFMLPSDCSSHGVECARSTCLVESYEAAIHEFGRLSPGNHGSL